MDLNSQLPPPWETEIPNNPVIRPKDLKGLWIPGNILQHPNLTWQEKILLTYIYHLDVSDRHCYASNKYLGELLGIAERNVAYTLHQLKKKKCVETISWDGRFRKLKVVDTLYLH